MTERGHNSSRIIELEIYVDAPRRKSSVPSATRNRYNAGSCFPASISSVLEVRLMKTRCFAALFLGLLTLSSYADESSGSDPVDSESLWITSIASQGDGSFVAGTATGLLLRPGSVSQFKADAPDQLHELYQHPAAVWTVAATSDGKTVASADYKGNLVVFDVASKKPTTHENAFERWCQKIVISPDDKSIVAGNESGKLFAWSIGDAKVSKSVELSKASITSIAFHPERIRSRQPTVRKSTPAEMARTRDHRRDHRE